eukprot:6585604-Pyramimonas_sp.AAC.1
MASDIGSVRLWTPIWVPLSQWRLTRLPISAGSTSPGSAADPRRFDSLRSPTRLLDRILGFPD